MDLSDAKRMLGISKGDTSTQMLAVVVTKEKEELYKPLFEKSGIPLGDREEDDAVAMYHVSKSSSQSYGYRVNDDVIVYLSKGIVSLGESEGLYFGLHAATSLLSDKLMKAMEVQDDKKKTLDSMSKTISDFNVYIESMVKDLPDELFKLEQEILQEARKKEETVEKEETVKEEKEEQVEKGATTEELKQLMAVVTDMSNRMSKMEDDIHGTVYTNGTPSELETHLNGVRWNKSQVDLFSLPNVESA